MYSFYGGQKGQDFKITRIFANRAIDMVGDLKARWTSPVNVGDYVFINYGDPSYMNEETSNYNINLQIDLKDSGKSYTNSLWQKIYVDRNLTVSPDFPQNNNNIYIFLNLEEDNKEEYGESLHEVSDLESEECFGFGYRLIACVTGVTPRIQVFHQTIDIEDGDPYVTLDLTNPDTPKIKFYLQRGQRIEEVYKNIVGSQEDPNVYFKTEGTYFDKNGNIKTATLTRPQLTFDLPKAPTFFSGSLFGLGPLSYFHNMGNYKTYGYQNYDYKYTIRENQVSILSRISYYLLHILKEDKIIYDENGNIIDNKHFFNNNLNAIYTQPDERVLFNPQNNLKITKLSQQLYTYLVDNFKLQQIKNELEYEWYWIDSEYNPSSQQNLFYLFNDMYPRSLIQVDQIIYSLFNILLKLINNNKKDDISSIYYFENSSIANYCLSILAEYATLGDHFYDITNNGYKADFYINEPTGKIYSLYEITSSQITGIYLGAITAPAPLAKTELVDSFIKDKDNSYIKNQIVVESSILEEDNIGTYQEIFNFSIPKYPDISIKTINVKNEQSYKVSNIKPISKNMEQIDLETPLPIHILTPKNSGLTVSIDTINNNIEKVIGNKESYIGPILSKNDLFINITDNLSDSTRGHIFQYKKDPVQSLEDQEFLFDNWEKIGTLTGLPGIPLAKKIINITAVEHLSNNIVYEGSEGNGNNDYIFNYNILKTYYVDHVNDGLEFIIKQILNGTKLNQEAIKNAGSSTPQLIINFGDNAGTNLPDLTINSDSGEVILINFYNPTLTSSYWGLYIQNNWDLISVSGNSQDSIISIQQNPQQEISKKTAYSSWYLDTQYLNNNLVWNKWIGITTKNLVDTSISIDGISKTNIPKFTAKEGDKITIHTLSRNKSTTEIGEITSKIFYNNTLMKESAKCQVAPSEGLWGYAEVTYEFNLKNDISIEVISEKYPDSSPYVFGQNVYITDYLD